LLAETPSLTIESVVLQAESRHAAETKERLIKFFIGRLVMRFLVSIL